MSEGPVEPTREVSWWWSDEGRPFAWYGVLAMIGVVGGMLWRSIVILPTFEVRPGLRAVPTSEGTMTAWFAADSWFSIMGIVTGLVIGVLAWRWFNHRGWIVTVHAVVGALLVALVVWQVGEALGPGPFADRLAAAQVGDILPIGFELRSYPAFLLWAFAAITPVMLAAAFSPDTDEEPAESETTMTA